MKSIAFGLASALGISVALASSLSLEARVHHEPFADSIQQDTAPHDFTTRNATSPSLFSRFIHQFDTRQEAGRCGQSAGGASCTGSQCCSTFDYCGTDPEHCGTIVGCQPQYGRCGDAPPDTPSPTPTPTPTPSSSSSSTAVPATSSSVVSSSSSVLPPLPSGTLIVSPSGQCGNATTCAGSGFGSCCSEWYFCGSGLQYCGIGCRSAFGTCNGVTLPPSSSAPAPIPSSSTTPIPTPTSTATPTPTTTSSTAPPVPTNVSTNGRCGAEGNGMTCSGSTYGRCCSDYGWCGTGDDFCRPSWGCRPQFGSCGST